jgi:methyl-accepting chemotaxis protein/ribose transport system substrate-binding protein
LNRKIFTYKQKNIGGVFVFKKLKTFYFHGNKTQSTILLVATLIPVFTILIAILSFVIPMNVFHYISLLVLLAIIVTTFFLLGMLIRFFKGVNTINQTAITLSSGNLNISDILSEKTKGLEVLTSAFNDVKRNLLSYIENTKSNVIILSDAVDRVTKSIDMSYKGNETIASNMSIVAEKAQEQLKIAKNTLDGIEEVSRGANRISDSLANIESFIGTTTKLTAEGTDHLKEYNGQIQLISTNLEEASAFIIALNKHLSEINQFGSLIMNITGQLNLLSLNSRVEAARAGAAGRGFAVVAQEMNKLSSQTQDSVKQINRLLDDILKSNDKVKKSINNVSDSFNISKKIFETINESFDSINQNANILNSDIKQVYQESIMISDNTKEITRQGVVLHDASNEISSITEDVAAVTEEELAENEEINTQAISLKKMLTGIENQLKRYKTSIAPVEQTSTKPLKLVMVSPINSQSWQLVKQGALYAQTELKGKNAEVEFIGLDNLDNTFIETVNQKIEEGCNGLIIPGFIKGIEKCAFLAKRKEIPVMAFNSDFPEGTERLSYFGPDIHGSGKLAAELLAKGMEEEGEVIIFKGDTTNQICKSRYDGILEKLSKYKGIKIVSQVDDIVKPIDVYKKLKEILYYLPNVNGMIFVSSGVTGVKKVIDEMKLKNLKVVCFDYDEEILDLVKKGVVHKTLGQDFFGQGHDPIIYLYNYLVAGEQPNDITFTRTDVVDSLSMAE